MNLQYLPDTNSHQLILRDQLLHLLPEKALFWEDRKCLILSDVHLGKAGHFRKSGIPIPKSIHQQDLDLIYQLIITYQPRSVLFLGDLFHSEINSEWWQFTQWLDNIKGIKFLLVLGNHDIFNKQLAHRKLQIFDNHLDLGPFRFCHKPAPSHQEDRYYVSGHLHPAVKLRGKSRQSVTCPCFYFSTQQALMPAFGHFTGYARILPRLGDQVFLVADGKVIKP